MIATERLDLVPASLRLLEAALASDSALGICLGAEVPTTWPPDYLDRAALEFTVSRLREAPGEQGWWMYFVVLRGAADGRRLLIGSGGYKGPPAADGTAEIGYGIVKEQRRRGYASEAAQGLLKNAFASPSVSRVIAETLPDLAPSIGVLRKSGFRFAGAGSEAGVIRFEITRATYEGGRGAA